MIDRAGVADPVTLSASREETRRMRVLMVGSGKPSVAAGGIGTVLRTLLRGLEGRHDVEFLVNEWAAPRPTAASERNLSFFLFRMRAPSLGDRWLRSLVGGAVWAGPTLARLARFVRERGIDVAHLHFAAPYQIWFVLLKKWIGLPYVVTLHRGDVLNFHELDRLERAAVRSVLRNADRVNAVSSWLAQEAQRTFGVARTFDVIHNGIDDGELKPLSPSELRAQLPGLPQRYFTIIANLAHYKGQDVAIRAWSMLPRRLDDVALVLVGEPRDLLGECEQLIERQGLAGRVHMTGALGYRLAASVLRESEGLIFPSRNEGLGYALLEAGLLRRPAICSDIGPFREIVQHGTSALLVPPDDPSALAAAVEMLVDDAELGARIAAELHRTVVTRFSATSMAAAYEDLYRAAVGRTAT